MSKKKDLTIVCFSGDFDKVVAAFTMATGAAATNRKVTMFFTFWGLNVLKKEQGRKFLGQGVLAKVFNFLMGGGNKLPLSRLNFAGASPGLMTSMMKKHNVATLPELIEAAHALGIRMLACEMALHILELERSDLIEEVEDVVGVATFLNESEDGHIIFV
ncbi:MAG: hypothetical protein AUK35_04110 [Zetaproteobacteria bacterium CG2_30_46_52]|nr:MAG: hypothetical protein AUK35_04110 [Zetaproteobacteria bacterium CG2_30_46_52]